MIASRVRTVSTLSLFRERRIQLPLELVEDRAQPFEESEALHLDRDDFIDIFLAIEKLRDRFHLVRVFVAADVVGESLEEDLSDPLAVFVRLHASDYRGAIRPVNRENSSGLKTA